MSDFLKLFSEWQLGVRSMQYQKNKGEIRPDDLERFRKLESRMDEAFRALPPFEQETLWAEIRTKMKIIK